MLTATVTGDYQATLTINAFDGEGGTFTIPVSATVTEPVYEITVADGSATSNYIPLYAYYWDECTRAQTIYNKADLTALAGKEITSVTYYPTANIDLILDGEATLSMGETELNFFYGNEAFLPVTACGTWTPQSDDSFTINFDTPYLYTGEENLVVDFNVTTPGSSYASGSFYGIMHSTSDNEKTFSMYQNSANPYTSAFVPKTTFGYREAEAPAESVTTVTPDFGTYEGEQTVMVSIENQPEGTAIVYKFTATEEPAGAARKAEGDIWQQYDPQTGIVVDRSGLLTVALQNANGDIVASIEGEYVINMDVTGIDNVVAGKTVASVRYYNAAGRVAAQAFGGVNIVVTTYTDGSQAVSKVVK